MLFTPNHRKFVTLSGGVTRGDGGSRPLQVTPTLVTPLTLPADTVSVRIFAHLHPPETQHSVTQRKKLN